MGGVLKVLLLLYVVLTAVGGWLASCLFSGGFSALWVMAASITRYPDTIIVFRHPTDPFFAGIYTGPGEEVFLPTTRY